MSGRLTLLAVMLTVVSATACDEGASEAASTTSAPPATTVSTTTSAPVPTTADPLAVATELADTWGQGWSDSNPEAVASVFTEDGKYFSFNGETYEGEGIADHVRSMGSQVANVIRIGELAETSAGTYTWVVEADLAGVRQRGIAEMELDGDLIATLTWAENPEPIDA